jgi:hypothetical protein
LSLKGIISILSAIKIAALPVGFERIGIGSLKFDLNIFLFLFFFLVHNWTNDDIIHWVKEEVKLPQYVENVKRNKIDGQFMPRFAINENNYFATVMQIKDPRHKSRFMLKATDLILFGIPPSKYQN